MGSRGVDLPAIASKIGAIQNTNIISESDTVKEISMEVSQCDLSF